MIVVKLMGGLGNQMFQYAAGRSLAQRTGSKLFMDLSWFDIAYTTDTIREYELDCFGLPNSFKSVNSLTLIEKFEPTLKSRLYKVTKGLRKPYAIHFIEKDQTYNKAFESLEGNVYLDGWWQSQKYFKDIRSQLLKDFTNKKDPQGQNVDWLKSIQSSNSISLHVRRGDYANNKNTKSYHGLIGLDYYKAASSKIAKKVKDPHFFVFSDEPEWCKKNLKLDFPTTYISGNKDGSEDLRLMKNCKHNIIANSSFSWWGAWLNRHPDKMVIAPKRWFSDPKANATDIVPAEWVRL